MSHTSRPAPSPSSPVVKLIESVYFVLAVTLFLGAIALLPAGGRYVITGYILLVLALAVAALGLRSLTRLPYWVTVGALGVTLASTGYYLTPEKTPTNTGTLFSATDHKIKGKVEFGDSKAGFELPNPTLMAFFEKYGLKIELIDGRLMVSTRVRNRKAQFVAENIRNEWKVAPAPRAWDRNYNENSLEVKDEDGRIVLQVRVLSGVVQVQGEWWIDEQNGLRLGTDDWGAVMSITPNGYDAEFESKSPIQPLFKYPIETHLGELN